MTTDPIPNPDGPEQPPVPDPGSPDPVLPEAPRDAPDATAKGYAVYDRVLRRYVGGVTTDKPSKSAVRELVGDHSYRTVRV